MSITVLSKLLRSAGLTHGDLAERLGVSVQAVTNWCTGRNSPHLDKLSLLADVLYERGVTRDEIRQLIYQEVIRQGLSANWFQERETSENIAIITWNNAIPGFQASSACLQKIMYRSGYTALVFDCMRDHEQKRKILDYVADHSFKGVLAHIPREGLDIDDEIREFSTRLGERRVPVVFLGDLPDGTPDTVGRVFWNQERIGACATNLLIQSGHEKIGGIFSGRSALFHSRTFNGFLQALQEAGVPYREDQAIWHVGLEVAPSQLPDEYNLRELISRCSGLILGGNPLLPVVARLLDEMGTGSKALEISVVDGAAPSDYRRNWTVHSVIVPYVEASRLAADMMLRMLKMRDQDNFIVKRVLYDEEPRVITIPSNHR